MDLPQSVTLRTQSNRAGDQLRAAAGSYSTKAWLSSLLFGVTCALTAAGLVFLALSWSAPVPDAFAFRGHAALFALAFGSMGFFLARRLPENSIGWLFLVMGLVAGIQEVGQEYAGYALLIHADALPATRLIGWVASWVIGVGLASIMMVVLLFPDGRLPSRRWRAFASLQGLLWTASIFASMIKPGSLRFAPFLDNPFGNARVWQIVTTVTGPLLALSIVVMGISIIRRLRRAGGVERQQLKWFAYTAALTCGVGIVYITAYPTLAVTEPALIKPIDILAIVIPLAIPFAIGLAILRYRLYDIDRVINRTLVYGTLSIGIIVTYVLFVGLLGTLLNRNVNLAAALVTAALAALVFQPLRARLQSTFALVLPSDEKPDTADDVQVSSSWLDTSLGHWLPWLLFGVACALTGGDVILLALNGAVALPLPSRWPSPVYALVFGGVGLVLARMRPQNSIGWLFVVFGVLAGISGFGTEYAAQGVLVHPGALPGVVVVAWIVSWTWIGVIAASVYLFLLFPTGHLPSARWRPLAWGTGVALAIAVLSQMLKAGPLRSAPYLKNPFAPEAIQELLNVTNPIIYVAVMTGQVASAASVIVRLRRARGAQRQQLKWFAYASALLVVVGALQSAPGNLGLAVPAWWNVFNFLLAMALVAFPFTVAVAILRYRLWDIDILINRTLVYGGLTAAIIALYILLVGALSTLSQTTGNLVISLLATGMIAILFQPFRERLQRGINRLMYGERDEPVALIARLGQNLETMMAPDALLFTLVRTIAEALKLPYVAIETRQGDVMLTAAAYGQASSQVQRIPLVYQGEAYGHLLVARRSVNESLSTADLNMLHIIAQQAGMAVHAVQLTADLQRSREQLVVAREEERRRIRRDLHDGLGPALASLAMQADEARESTRTDPDKTEAALEDIASKAQEALKDIRRLVYGLRPPALDELGLIGALRQGAANAPNGVHIDVDAPESMPALPAAVEVAAFRIVQETLNNVARHSHAQCCTVVIAVSNELSIEITDDGVGLPSNLRSGVGMISLRERAAELGGTCVVESVEGGGARVIARLPLAHKRSQNG